MTYDEDLYVCKGVRLGDTLLAMNNAIHIAKSVGRRIKFSLSPKINNWSSNDIIACHQRLEVAKYLYEYEPFIEIIDHMLVRGVYTPRLHTTLTCPVNNARPFNDTIKGLCCTHLSGKWKLNKNEKAGVIKKLESNFISVVDCNSTGLMSAVELITKCECFVGMCSGFSHVAHAAGRKTHLIRGGQSFGRIRKWHAKSEYTDYEDANEFVKRWSVGKIETRIPMIVS